MLYEITRWLEVGLRGRKGRPADALVDRPRQGKAGTNPNHKQEEQTEGQLCELTSASPFIWVDGGSVRVGWREQGWQQQQARWAANAGEPGLRPTQPGVVAF